MRLATKRRVRLFVRVVLIGTLLGIAYGGLTGLVFKIPIFLRSLVGSIDGALIPAPIAPMENFPLPSLLGPPLHQAPFLVTLAPNCHIPTPYHPHAVFTR